MRWDNANRRLFATTQDAMLERFGTSTTYLVATLVERRRLSNDTVRWNRCRSLGYIIEAELEEPEAFSRAVQVEPLGRSLRIRTLPENQERVAELLRAIQE